MTPDDVLAPADVLSGLIDLEAQNLPLNLIYPYKSMLLNQAVSVLEFRQDGVLLQATNLKMCAVLAGHAYLHSQALPKPVDARVIDLNISTGMVILSDFTYQKADWKTRDHERFSPRCPVYVTAYGRSGAFRACVENVSIDGMGALAYKLEQLGLDLRPGCSVRLDFSLPPDITWIGLKAVIVYLQHLGGYMTRLGMRLHPHAGQVPALEQWITDRHKSILGELDQVYWRLKDSLRTDYQFF